ncbi:MAG: hypothetical protein LBR24_04350 [Methanobrevibacter sp.]|jgi:hypothetical protein|nr:hypothetical protein [Methanobrevibacter sp.]
MVRISVKNKKYKGGGRIAQQVKTFMNNYTRPQQNYIQQAPQQNQPPQVPQRPPSSVING